MTSTDIGPAGADSLAALLSGRRFNLVSPFARIAAALIVADQPLIQRASTIVAVRQADTVVVKAAIAPEIPYGYTAYQMGRGRALDSMVMTQPMIAVLDDYNQNAPITQGFSGCTDSCTGIVQAGGFTTNCTTATGPVDDSFIIQQGNTVGQTVSPFNVTWSLPNNPPG